MATLRRGREEPIEIPAWLLDGEGSRQQRPATGENGIDMLRLHRYLVGTDAAPPEWSLGSHPEPSPSPSPGGTDSPAIRREGTRR